MEGTANLVITARPNTEEIDDIRRRLNREQRVASRVPLRTGLPAASEPLWFRLRKVSGDLASVKDAPTLHFDDRDGPRRLVLVVPTARRPENP